MDAQGVLARFTDIQSIAVDSHDNVYVVDRGNQNSSLRKISADGSVTSFNTLEDPTKQIASEELLKDTNLAGLGPIGIRDDILYITGFDCIRSIDLKQPQENLTVKTLWGACKSLKERNGDRRLSPNKTSEMIVFDKNIIIKNKAIYAIGGSDSKGTFILKLEENQKQAEFFNITGIQDLAVDSKGRFYIPSSISKVGQVDSFMWIWQPPASPIRSNQYYYPLIKDSNDQLYGLQGTKIVRIVSGEIHELAQLPEYDFVAHVALNPSETNLYIAVQTGIYRVSLPQNPKQ